MTGNCGNKQAVVSSRSPDERHDILSTILGVLTVRSKQQEPVSRRALAAANERESSGNDQQELAICPTWLFDDRGFLTRVEETLALESLPEGTAGDCSKFLLALARGWENEVIVADVSNCDWS